jgi:hypothetical protein
MVHALELWIDTGIDYVRGRLRIVVDTHTEEGEFIEPRDRIVELHIEGTDAVVYLTPDQTRHTMAGLQSGLGVADGVGEPAASQMPA